MRKNIGNEFLHKVKKYFFPTSKFQRNFVEKPQTEREPLLKIMTCEEGTIYLSA